MESFSESGRSKVMRTSASSPRRLLASPLITNHFLLITSHTLCGGSFATGCPHWRQCSVARCGQSTFRWSQISVIVPTVLRVLRTALRCSMAMAGGIPSMLSTAGLSMRSKNCRA